MINSTNEWGKLTKVMVGSATNANWPSNDPVFALESEKTLWKETPVPSGPVPQWIIDETNEDLDNLSSILTKLGIEVHRPVPMDFVALHGMYNFCPRDRLIIAGDIVIDPAMMYPCRDQEIKALEYVTSNASKVIRMPRDQGMVLDAANISRLGNKWLFLESASGNRKAYDWLCEQLPHIEIELVNFYSGVHIDSTICPLNEGFVVLNASRVTPRNCPKAFKDWTKLWVTDVNAQSFHEYPYASKWIGLNMFSISPTTVIVDAKQYDLMDDLDKAGFTVVPLQIRHSRTLGGAFHCVTLDLNRQIG